MSVSNFSSKRTRAVTIDEFNQILQRFKNAHVVFYPWEQRKQGETLKNTAFLVDKMVHIEFTTMYWDFPHPTTYRCRKDGADLNPTTGRAAFKEFQKYYKSPRLDNDKEFCTVFEKNKTGSFINSASPLVGFNPEFDAATHEVWVYDALSAYAEPLLSVVPDTRKKRYRDYVHAGEVGFIQHGARGLILTEIENSYADVICPLMSSPWRGFVQLWFDRKQNPRDTAEKLKAKSMLTFAVGYLQRTNPLLRCWVVEKCNKKIRMLLDENSILWNTDAIYSLTPRDDIKLGENIGDFRLEYHGMLEHYGCNYHKIDTHEYSVRGVPKSWFQDDTSILNDPLPTKTGENLYYFDKERFMLCLNSKHQTQD